ncbi:DUF1150 family protein [Mameliella sediminis]|uniref:DUF1150 family protein n=1 Tax=Mameliella sediminis TaxID=2836866 RepID=UPI001C4704B5|nr:DUF1150 family protein [Mameliella sediminis]MBY6113650.1 DUF1150 domain-containing protein [Antarctobacter heliothermus]MBY6143002.1 DUF1150 domain-containing protein [Mameliella alba]MBV7394947.1 DUF1150 domain-containing protein [Mameliella sediminis]MBY6159857.1 DUF1150 domain-containing protein [Mameliella alba]MBY6168328.1 DUF1150 domain-containing protein [Mameliella alba]
MHAKYDFDKLSEGRTVYVRSVKTADLPDELRRQVEDVDTLYAVHRADDGERLALVKDRSLAFVLARQNDLAPVTVH